MAFRHEDIGKRFPGPVCPALNGAFILERLFPSSASSNCAFPMESPWSSAPRALYDEHLNEPTNDVTLYGFYSSCLLDGSRHCRGVTRLRQMASLGRTTWAGHHQGDLLN